MAGPGSCRSRVGDSHSPGLPGLGGGCPLQPFAVKGRGLGVPAPTSPVSLSPRSDWSGLAAGSHTTGEYPCRLLPRRGPSPGRRWLRSSTSGSARGLCMHAAGLSLCSKGQAAELVPFTEQALARREELPPRPRSLTLPSLRSAAAPASRPLGERVWAPRRPGPGCAALGYGGSVSSGVRSRCCPPWMLRKNWSNRRCRWPLLHLSPKDGEFPSSKTATSRQPGRVSVPGSRLLSSHVLSY